MKHIPNFKFWLFTIGALALTACAHSAPETARDASVNTELPAPIAITPLTLRAERLDRVMTDLVDEGNVPGISVLIFEGDQEVYFNAAGYAGMENKAPLRRDAVGRYYSMTKPIVGVALMKLYEQGKFQLNDPLSMYLPEYKNMRVFTGVTKTGEITHIPATRQITVLDLMRHTAGFTYGFTDTPIDRLYAEQNLLGYNQTNSQFSQRLAKLPLLHAPSTQYHYSVSVDVQGRLIEVLSGQSLGVYLEENIFTPLGMSHTGFMVKAVDRDKFSPVYGLGEDGLFKMFDGSKKVPLGLNVDAPFLEHRALESGGGGLVSSLDDYAKFALMLQRNDGQIIKPKTMNLMTRDHLGPIDNGDLGDGVGFGLDFAIKLKPLAQGAYAVPQGSFYWGGMAGTEFLVDRKTGKTILVYKQVMQPNWWSVRARLTKAIYGPQISPKR